jgi:magnesium-transporting ATPase (P-type)
MAGLALGIVAWGEHRYSLVVATTMGLTTLSLMHIVGALEVRETSESIFTRYTIANRRFVQLIGIATVLTFLVTSLGPLQRIFDTVALTSSQWGICLLGPDRVPRVRRAGETCGSSSRPRGSARVGDVVACARQELSCWRPSPASCSAHAAAVAAGLR